ncbi:hypothetical protein LG3211_1713 [Lysobacter gummosus]|nr:hypothetical protein LG3211_1713 [Lysobacter gummosus]
MAAGRLNGRTARTAVTGRDEASRRGSRGTPDFAQTAPRSRRRTTATAPIRLCGGPCARAANPGLRRGPAFRQNAAPPVTIRAAHRRPHPIRTQHGATARMRIYGGPVGASATIS